MRPVRRATILLAAAASLAAAFGGITLASLEGNEVAVLVTTSPDGSPRRTRVWFAEHDGALWVEAATAERPFYTDLASRPRLRVERPGQAGAVEAVAEFVPEPGGHDRIRALLAAKYGWADDWVALLQDTSASRAVRLLPEADGAAR